MLAETGGAVDVNAVEAERVQSIWQEQVPILNATTKTYAGLGEEWSGRTVKVADVARRWCRFEALPEARRMES